MITSSCDAIIGLTKFPSLKATMMTNNPEYLDRMGFAGAIQSRQLGFQWTFAPCVDLLKDFESPIMGIRCPGETLNEVITAGLNYLQGLQASATIATLKHFPGVSYSKYDQPLTVGQNLQTKEEWDQTFRIIYNN